MLPLLVLLEDISMTQQLLLSAPFILLLGIPHGAIDNILVKQDLPVSNAHFIALYVAIIGINMLLWIVLPQAAYVLFLLLSAFHFGQSQFSHYFKNRRLVHRALSFSWGLAVLSALILFNIEQIDQLTSGHPDFASFAPLHPFSFIQFLFGTATAATLVILIWLAFFHRELKREHVLLETIILALIFTTFYLVPLIIGFTLYFVVLHSYKVLGEEYRFLRLADTVKSRFGFIKLLTPFSLLSFLGIAALFFLIYFGVIDISYGYCVLIIISSITLPHVFVMNQFYKRFS